MGLVNGPKLRGGLLHMHTSSWLYKYKIQVYACNPKTNEKLTADKIKAVGVRGFELALGFKDVG